MKHYSYRNNIVTLLSIKELRRWQKKYKIRSDDAFQASSIFEDKDGSHGRWAKELREWYFQSLAMGTAPTPFILVDVKKCYDAAVKAERQDDIEYYKKWVEEGVDYLILDAYNREETIDFIFNNKVELIPDEYELDNGDNCVITKGYNTWFKLPRKMKAHILRQNISFCLYENVVRVNLSEICKRVNLGEAWTKALFRNTHVTYRAKKVRSFIYKWKDFFIAACDSGAWFKPHQLKLRIPDVFIQQMMWIDLYSFISSTRVLLDDNALDKMYETPIDEKQVDASMTRIDEFFKMMENTKDAIGGCKYFALKNRIVILHLFELYITARKAPNSLVVDKEKYHEIYKSLMDAHTHYSLQQGPSDKHPEHFYETKKGTLKLYKVMITGLQYMNVQICHKLLKEMFKFEEFCYKPGKRVVDDSDKAVIAHKRGNITPEGDIIHQSRINTGDFEKGHGLETFASNPEKDADINDTYIQTKQANKKQGNKPIPSLEKKNNEMEVPA